MQPGVLEPQLDVLARVHDLALDDQGVAVGVQPGREALVPRPAALDHPVAQHLAPPAVGEQVRRLAHDVLDDPVAGQAGVAVDEPLAGRRGDDERRVGRDEVEALPAQRLEERPLPHVHGDLVERRVETRHPQRAGVDVGRDDLPGVGGEVQRLDAAAGAEVEGPADGLADRELGQAGRRAGDAEHVVAADPVRGAVEAGSEVGDDPQVLLVGAVGPAVEPRRHLPHALLEQARVAEPVDEPGERPLRLVVRHRRLEQEEPGQGGERAAVRRTPQARRGLVAAQRAVAGLAQLAGDAVVGEVGRDEGVAQGSGEVEAHALTPLSW